jgi:membrane protease YdiL (CAAX protease family)
VTTGGGVGISRVRATLAALCGAVLIVGGLGHVAINLTGARATRVELLVVHAALIAAVSLASAPRAHGRKRGLYVFGAALAVAGVLALLATPNPALQQVERSASLGVLMGYSLAWATTPLRRALGDGLDVARFGVGLFVADQLAAYGIGGLILVVRPELALQSWPLSVVGELVQQSCLILVLVTCALAAPALIDSRGLRLPGRGWTKWRPVVIAALQVEFGVIAFQLALGVILRLLRIDVGNIGNAAFPAPGDWEPSLPAALLLLAVLPGIIEELVFRGVVFRAMRGGLPLTLGVVISSVLFGLGHLSPDMTPANMASVFGNAFAFGCLAAVAYQRSGSLYAAILAHVFSNTGPALAVVLPPELMPWVFLATVELSVVGMLPVAFAVIRRHRQPHVRVAD